VVESEVFAGINALIYVRMPNKLSGCRAAQFLQVARQSPAALLRVADYPAKRVPPAPAAKHLIEISAKNWR
jgi:hypothetical protein